jgi:hypothetical protein
MASKKRCYDLAEKLGATIDDSRGDLVILTAPKFMTCDVDLHERFYDCSWGRGDLWKDVWQDLKFGFDECDLHKIGECEWCDEVVA